MGGEGWGGQGGRSIGGGGKLRRQSYLNAITFYFDMTVEIHESTLLEHSLISSPKIIF